MTRHDDTMRAAFGWQSGFIAIGLLWGLAVGYILADWPSRSQGYTWDSNIYDLDFILSCFLIGSVIGIACGAVLDACIRNHGRREMLLKFSAGSLVTCALFYFTVIAPAIQGVRE